jgi:hypothetical protein
LRGDNPTDQAWLAAIFVALDTVVHRAAALKQMLDQHPDDPPSRQPFWDIPHEQP